MTEIKPISQNKREPLIDILRGWALLSVVVMNYSSIYSWNNHFSEHELSSFNQNLQFILELVFESKGWTLLAILFGYGFSILLSNISKSGIKLHQFFAKRMMWLFLFGFFNSLFFGGDILTDYALIGLILLCFYRLNKFSLTVLILIVFLLTPVLQSILGNYQLLFTPKFRDIFYELYNHNNWLSNIEANLYMRYIWMLRPSYSIILHFIQLGCFLTGVLIHRKDFLIRISVSGNVLLKRIVLFSFIFSLVLYQLHKASDANDWKIDEYYNFYYPLVLSVMIFTTSFICWIYYSGYFKIGFNLLCKVGKMTLTNYIIQNILAFILFICIRPNWDYCSYISFGILIYFIQLFLSNWWLSKFNYGFFEWIWRCLSYQKWIPLVKEIQI